MDGTVNIAIYHGLLERMSKIHDEYKRLSPSMATQDINYMIVKLIENEESRLGLSDDKPYPPTDRRRR